MKLLILFIIIATNISANNISIEERNKLLGYKNKIFDVKDGINVNFNISTDMLTKELSEIEQDIIYDQNYLSNMFDSLKIDSSNIYYYVNISNYYEYNLNQDSTLYFLKLAYEKFDENKYKNDPKALYGLRCFLKLKLDKEDWEVDFKELYKIDPGNDFIQLYIMKFIEETRFEELREILLSNKNNNLDLLQYKIFFYYFTLSAEKFSNFKAADSINKKKIVSSDFFEFNEDNKFIEFLEENKNYDDLEKIKNSMLIYSLLSKYGERMIIQTFEKQDTVNFYITFNEMEKEKINYLLEWIIEMENKKELNIYTINYFKGYIYFVLNEFNLSKEYFNKALEVFDNFKRTKSINESNPLSLLVTMSRIEEDLERVEELSLQALELGEIYNQNYVKDIVTLSNIEILRNNFSKAKKYIEMVQYKYPNDYYVIKTLIFLNLLDKKINMALYYLKKVEKVTPSEEEFKNIILMISIFEICDGLKKEPLERLTLFQKEIECKECQELIDRYLVE